jgi:hypothetical protein
MFITPLSDLLPKCTNLTPRKSKAEKRKKERDFQRKYKQAVESVFQQRDMLTFYYTRESASSYEKRRRSLRFESKTNENKLKGINSY